MTDGKTPDCQPEPTSTRIVERWHASEDGSQSALIVLATGCTCGNDHHWYSSPVRDFRPQF